MKNYVERIFNTLGVKWDIKINEGENIVQSVANNIQLYVINNLSNFNINKTTVEGESKRVFKDSKSDICLIKLKPTMYSYTHGRYGIVEGVDELRNEFWKVFSDEINITAYESLFMGRNFHSKKVFYMLGELIENNKLTLDYPFLTSYLGQVKIDGIIYNICRFCKDETPLEVVWKKYLVGTMKHRLLNVDKWNTRCGIPIKYEQELLNEFVRFDWRNPNEFDGERYCDECIPDDFANIYIDVKYAKLVCLVVSNIISEQLQRCGYKFVDTCYFINSNSNYVFSEITPDGMRIKKISDNSKSFDKDLWRQGKDSETINKIWIELLNDLKKER